jgi:hypothetical protein
MYGLLTATQALKPSDQSKPSKTHTSITDIHEVQAGICSALSRISNNTNIQTFYSPHIHHTCRQESTLVENVRWRCDFVPRV